MSVKTTVIPNGPLKIEGDITLLDGLGKEFGLAGRTSLFLCRCAMSENKPFCDGHHKACGFESACAARELPPPVARPVA